MKIIPTTTLTLQRRVEDLEVQLAEKDAKILRLEETLKQKSRNVITSRKDSLTSIRSETSFRSSITTTRRRSVAVSTPGPALDAERSLSAMDAATTSLPSPLYHDGQLIKEANFIKSTWSTIYRTRGKYRPRDQDNSEENGNDVSPIESLPGPWDPSEANTTWSELAPAGIEPTSVCTTCAKLEWSDSHPQAQSLENRSRLYPHTRDPFYNPKNPASDMYPPNRLMSRLLRRALRLAQETVWTAFRAHWPEEQRRRYLEGPEEVKLGFDEVESALRHWSWGVAKEGEVEKCGYGRKAAYSAMSNMSYLRNAVCHPDWRTPWSVDSLLRDAQALAVTMRDEPRAFKIRALRDELQAAQLQAHDELLSFVGLASLPGAKPWSLHHQRLFADVTHDISTSSPGKYDHILLRAAKEWETKYIRPGQLDPSYLNRAERAADNIEVPEKADRENMARLRQIQRVTRSMYPKRYEQARKYMQETPGHGRRASLPGAMPGVPGNVLELKRESVADIVEQRRNIEREVKELSPEQEESAKAAWPAFVEAKTEVHW
ncbi:hypothetical protein LTR78_008179 [Recurvomyces mirabilis]|uniref:Uncharacterized protein n=1 Tax=Recurvomyces mirabilis TaxID=574656 RepID=A0AAE0TTJ0_9PEZI|nr:hypothetical protein LTR78_008179 [Recurvomyces mirabilis]KAK5150622.1 hypothetical protein LTS14_009905 [Recurvomyces mirabilis]